MTYPKFVSVILLTCTLLLLDGCAALEDLSNSIQKPQLSVENVRVSDFNFEEIELTYDIKVNNPNALSVQMLAYDYNLDINENTLVSGDQKKQLAIEASGESTFQVPMRLNFADIYRSVQSLRNSEEASYNFLSNLTFDLPVLGQTKVPVSKEGRIPLLKTPRISLEDFNVTGISLSSADINLQLRFDNPNSFVIDVHSLNYDLMINGDQWANGTALEGATIKQKGVTTLNIPISLNISKIGMSAYRLLTGDEAFKYQIKGDFDLNARHELLGQTTFDFLRSGNLSLPSN
ncbi:LEA type 2 family protein [Fodinibius sp.]|uniref:LEA type 2 family protein n=1 Tax=Fodinibius sp. TaxID=1872440 RepID=UPI002ACD89CD|nr:LEA type 2 family protein [Fodinibius sp.]MDZ7659299.1 LEA type 2 family protein [Fodinibius sp.]